MTAWTVLVRVKSTSSVTSRTCIEAENRRDNELKGLAATVYEVPQMGIRGVRATVAKLHTAPGTKAPVGKRINLESVHSRRNGVLSQEEANHRRLFLSDG